VSETSKRPGARDISELKARLGLKKAGGPAAKTGGGMTPPPGARLGNAIPAPPGARPPQPVIPDANQDPFAAMNAMAAHGAVAAQPQIVIVNDGQGVESVERKSKGMRIAMIAGAFLVPLIFGSLIGKVAAQNKAINSTLDDAGKLRDDVTIIGKSLITLQQTLQLGKERGAGGNAFLLNDAKMTADLEALKLVEPSFALLTQLQLTSLPDSVAQETLELYSETVRLNASIKDHITKSKADAKVLQEGQAKASGFNPFGYGALITVPNAEDAAKGAPVSIKLVQLGQPICQGDSKPSDGGCQGPPAGFQFRSDETAAWGVKKLAAAENGAVGGDALALLDPGSKVLEGLVKGGGASVAEAAYMTRINAISDKVDALVEIRKDVETKLNAIANRGRSFTFFM
jgi:hypothetical protein